MPALLFAVADVIDRDQPFFQERLVAAFRLGHIRVPELLSALADAGNPLSAPPAASIDGLPTVIASLEALPPSQPARVLAPFSSALATVLPPLWTCTQQNG